MLQKQFPLVTLSQDQVKAVVWITGLSVQIPASDAAPFAAMPDDRDLRSALKSDSSAFTSGDPAVTATAVLRECEDAMDGQTTRLMMPDVLGGLIAHVAAGARAASDCFEAAMKAWEESQDVFVRVAESCLYHASMLQMAPSTNSAAAASVPDTSGDAAADAFDDEMGDESAEREDMTAEIDSDDDSILDDILFGGNGDAAEDDVDDSDLEGAEDGTGAGDDGAEALEHS
jgi:hypothetical protein